MIFNISSKLTWPSSTAGCANPRADYLNQVAESNELNNSRSIDPIC